MADLNYNPNARYDHGPNAAGCGRVSNQDLLQVGSGGDTGLKGDGALAAAELRVGFSAAGALRTGDRSISYVNNSGPNVAGAPRSVNNT